MFFCKMASKSDFDTFLAQFWMDFGVILEASGRHVGDFLVLFFKASFLTDFCVSGGYRVSLGSPQGRDFREGKLLPEGFRGEG